MMVHPKKGERRHYTLVYYISFIEECIQNPKYLEYTGGRIEVFENGSPYAIEEIRWFTKDIDIFREFRDKWDMKEVSKRQLTGVKKTAKWFCEYPKP